MPPEDPPLFPYPESEIDRVLTVALPLVPLEWNGFDDFVTEFEGPQVGATYIEVRELKVDTRQLLEVIKRIFRSPEVFLRELISNASDALGRFKLQSLGWHPELSVVLEIDKTEKTFSITDNGIGMTKADLKHELGTIGWSGTNKYREYLKLQELSDPSMIGEFGCCFFAAFLVAHKVQVFSKHDEDEQYMWESQGDGFFTVIKDVHGEKLVRGTKVTLFLKADQMEYLEEGRIEELVKKHSEFISYPIYLSRKLASEFESDPVGLSSTETDQKIINDPRPCWLSKPEEVSMAEYVHLFKRLTSDEEDLLAFKHFSMPEANGIIFVPKSAPFQHYDTREKSHNIKLYVRRVLIMDKSDQLVPEYLEFVKGVVGSDHLPLNICREMPRQRMTLDVVRKNIVKYCFEMFNEIAKNKTDYTKFYEAFSKNLKLGIHADRQNRTQLANLLRYHSTKCCEELTSFQEYVTRMKDGQNVIYYVNCESKKWRENCSILELLKEMEYEFLLMVDADIYTVEDLKEYDGKKLVSAFKDGLELIAELRR